MKHLHQDKLSNCGQTCMAMLTRRGIRRVEREMHTAGGTRFPDLRQYLHERGWTVGPFERWGSRRWPMKPVRCLALLFCHRGKERHWAIISNGVVFDPMQDAAASYSTWAYCTGYRVSSYAELVRRPHLV